MVTLIVLDGFGQRRTKHGNAIKHANIPNIKKLLKEYPSTTLGACGGFVGLPKGQEGNSEAGHINRGAGKIIKQDLVRIEESIVNGEFKNNPAFLQAFKNVKTNNSNLHLIGLCSDGGLHSQISHLKLLLSLAKEHNIKNVYLHLFTDGRDTPINSGKKYVKSIENFTRKLGVGKIATIGGRVYGMDREKRYDRLKLAYDSIVHAQSQHNFSSSQKCFEHFYSQNIFDEFISPSVIDGGKTVENKDSVIFFNYRTDRARELTDAMTQKDFSAFSVKPLDIEFVCFTEYDKTFKDVLIAFPPLPKTPPLGQILSDNQLKQFRVSETTKYAHVTFFFNGGQENPFVGEDRELIETKNLKDFSSFPQMRAKEIAQSVAKAVKSEKYDFILANLSNCDMIGHTGNFQATIKAVEAVDKAVGEIYKACKLANCHLIVTADHGNADNMLTKDNQPITSHSLSLVPFILISEKFKDVKLKNGLGVANISPTILKLLGIKPPKYFEESIF